MDSTFKRITKLKLSEFTLEEARGWIIDRTYQIESKMDSLITKHFEPNHSNEFKNIMLNSSVIGFVGKAKILCGCKIISNKEFSKIAEMARIRNSFAHTSVFESIVLVTKEEKTEIESIKHMMTVMNSRGNIDSIDARELLERFWQLNKVMRQALRDKAV